MENDLSIRRRVEDELFADPSVTAEGIGVAVKDGVVTLSGHVPAYTERFAATRCAQRVKGVKAVALDLFVRLPSLKKRADDEIAGRAVSILTWTLHGVGDIQVSVEGGWVTLSGEVEWGYQKRDAERAIRVLGGVTGVKNAISIRHQVDPQSIRDAIQTAFQRGAALEGSGINVEIDGSTVTLSGKVKAWHERRAAEDAAWTVPGVSEVHDYLVLA